MGRSLSEQYAVLFGRPWSIWGSAVLVATVNVFLFAFDRPWTASDGMRNGGDWVLTVLGIVRRADLLAPWLYSGSLLNGGVLLGGLVAALLSSEFAIRLPPQGELAKGAIGGLLMGVGAVLAFGCNIGGFFSAHGRRPPPGPPPIPPGGGGGGPPGPPPGWGGQDPPPRGGAARGPGPGGA